MAKMTTWLYGHMGTLLFFSHIHLGITAFVAGKNSWYGNMQTVSTNCTLTAIALKCKGPHIRQRLTAPTFAEAHSLWRSQHSRIMPRGGKENGGGTMVGPTHKHLHHNPFVSCRTRVREALPLIR